ncbi:rhomboid-domain-containing protein [Auriscalpium vulgare]|uniref:Rhomboid-domain-containing protein n=1 Tax=Auriscalpium vulgare TaxID=40419 RepID=A0ACB8S1A3_9AGAM|nr:rhomboid-domain-containing protein [Auriscalpium vulgare]
MLWSPRLLRTSARSFRALQPRPPCSNVFSHVAFVRPPVAAPPRLSPLLARLSGGIVRFSRSSILAATHRDLGPVPSFASKLAKQQRPGPWRRFTGPINRIPPDLLFYGIIAVNVTVFSIWSYSTVKYRMQGVPDLIHWMHNNFTVSWRNIKQGRLWTILTSCFSHKDVEHILMNGLTFFFMAPSVLSILGNARFLALYFGGGIIASLTSLAWHRSGPDYSSHGASGAIYAVISFFACVAPNTKFLIFFVIPCPAWAFVGGVFLLDSYSAIANKRMTTDTAGHVGGLLAGIAYYVFRTRFRI